MNECIVCGVETKNSKYCSHICVGKDRKGKTMSEKNKSALIGIVRKPRPKGLKYNWQSPGGRFKKGVTPWNIGKKMSEEFCVKMSIARKGIPSSRKGKPSVHSGEKHYNWKGGITPEIRVIRTSRVYALWRKEVFERDNYTCQECFQRGGELHADHIKSFKDYPDLRLDVSNGRTLCRQCHYRITWGHDMINPETAWGLNRKSKEGAYA